MHASYYINTNDLKTLALINIQERQFMIENDKETTDEDYNKDIKNESKYQSITYVMHNKHSHE